MSVWVFTVNIRPGITRAKLSTPYEEGITRFLEGFTRPRFLSLLQKLTVTVTVLSFFSQQNLLTLIVLNFVQIQISNC